MSDALPLSAYDYDKQTDAALMHREHELRVQVWRMLQAVQFVMRDLDLVETALRERGVPLYDEREKR
jgi:hypothetical protein